MQISTLFLYTSKVSVLSFLISKFPFKMYFLFNLPNFFLIQDFLFSWQSGINITFYAADILNWKVVLYICFIHEKRKTIFPTFNINLIFSSKLGNTTYFEWSQCSNSEETCAQWNQFQDFGTLELRECDMECEIDSFTICESVTGMFYCHQNGTSSVSFNEINITKTNGN